MSSHVLIRILQVPVIAAVVAGAQLMRRRLGWRLQRLAVAAGAIALLAAGVAVAGVVTSARRSAIGPRAGTTTCVAEDSASRLIPYVNWLRSRLPPGAVYRYVGAPASVTTTSGFCGWRRSCSARRPKPGTRISSRRC